MYILNRYGHSSIWIKFKPDWIGNHGYTILFWFQLHKIGIRAVDFGSIPIPSISI